ncbi:MAG: hypothetical protein ACHQRM_11765 [Bacteroidia bacterium]
MGSETGTINSVDSSITGTILRDNGLTPNPIAYYDTSLIKRGIKLTVGERVSYNLDSNGNPTVVTPLSVVDPDFPPDQGTVISSPYSGDLVVDSGTITTISGTTITGNITVNGGTLILKSSDQTGAVPAQISGDVKCITNSNLTVYKSSIAGGLSFHNAQELTIKGGSVGGDTDIHNSQKIKNQGSVGGDTDIKNCAVIIISGLTINGTKNGMRINNTTTSTAVSNVVVNNGNALIHNNTGCSYSNITAPQGKVDITGCTGS